MSAYSVGTAYGGRVWWENWTWPPNMKDVRPATAEESALMEKVIWNNDTAEDRAKIRELINQQEPRKGRITERMQSGAANYVVQQTTQEPK